MTSTVKRYVLCPGILFEAPIAGNRCKDYYQKKKEAPTHREELEQSVSVSPVDVVIEKVLIEMALWELPPEIREVLALYYFQGLRLSDTAQVSGITLSLAKCS